MLPPDPEFMTTDEVADLLRVSINTVYFWRQRGVGPRGYKFGKSLRFRRAEVLEWAAAQAESYA